MNSVSHEAEGLASRTTATERIRSTCYAERGGRARLDDVEQKESGRDEGDQESRNEHDLVHDRVSAGVALLLAPDP